MRHLPALRPHFTKDNMSPRPQTAPKFESKLSAKMHLFPVDRPCCKGGDFLLILLFFSSKYSVKVNKWIFLLR